MKNNNILKHILFSAIGLIMIITGFILIKPLDDADNFLQSLPYTLIGIGSGVFGLNLGSAISKHIMTKNPKAAKLSEIEERDERNIAIRNNAKSRSYDLMAIVFGVLMLVFSFMRVDAVVMLLFIVCYLFVVFSNIYFIYKFQKEM